MFRIAKPESYLLLSPTREQVAGQNATQALALIDDPKSQFYTSPVVVLDFQSLYPSIMIAYNYCYSTCLGRVDGEGEQKLGTVTDYHRPSALAETIGMENINSNPSSSLQYEPVTD